MILAMARNFRFEVPDDLFEQFSARAMREYGSLRQAALALLRAYVRGELKPPPEGTGHEPDR
jgi:hypothetical protein